MNCDTTRGKLVEQPCDGSRDLTFTRHEHRPLELFPKLARADAPGAQFLRCPSTDANQRPMASECKRCRTVGERPADNEVVVSVDEYADQARSVAVRARALLLVILVAIEPEMRVLARADNFDL